MLELMQAGGRPGRGMLELVEAGEKLVEGTAWMTYANLKVFPAS